MTVEQALEMNKENLLKFINSKMKHKGTRKEDKAKLADCYLTLTAGNPLDATQSAFLSELKTRLAERDKGYSRKARMKKKVKVLQEV